MYGEWNILSGFAVLLRKHRDVVFYPGFFIEKLGPGTRFTVSNGLFLGKLENLNLKLLFPEKPIS
jgi:hypothetical protein